MTKTKIEIYIDFVMLALPMTGVNITNHGNLATIVV